MLYPLMPAVQPPNTNLPLSSFQALIHLPTRSIALSPLYAPINATLSSFRVSSVKIELTLMKSQVGLRWNSISTAPPPTAPAMAPPLNESDTASVPTKTTPESTPPPPPPKVSRFKARQAEMKGSPVPAPAATPTPTPSVQTPLPPLVSDPTERTVSSSSSAAAPAGPAPPAVVQEEEEAEQPKKRVSRFKAERTKA